MKNAFLILLAAVALVSAQVSGPRGRAIKADQVLLDTNSFTVVTNDYLQGAIEDLDAAAFSNAADIAALQTGAFSTNTSYTYANGTTQSVDNLVIRTGWDAPNGIVESNHLADASVGTNSLNNEVLGLITNLNYDYSTFREGYPIVTLNTNMAFYTVYGDALVQADEDAWLDNVYLVIDSDRSSGTTSRIFGQASRNHGLWLDLGESMSGYADIKFETVVPSPLTASQAYVLFGYQDDDPSLETYPGASMSSVYRYPYNESKTNTWLIPLQGRYLGVLHNSDSVNNELSIKEITVWANSVSNVYTNLGGW